VDFLDLLAQSLGVAMGMTAIVLVVFLVGSVFYVRFKVKGGVFCHLLAANKQLGGYLLKPQGFAVEIGAGDKAGMYIIHPSKQFWSFWPPGFPRIIQEPVPTYLYSEGNAEPIDPFDRKALISPESLRRISDDSMLKQTWKDVKEGMGIKGKPVNLKLLAAIAIGIIAAIALYAYFVGF